uniref:Uncharacterized protein n=1 Tax=Borely moumouvirus TaxID=2712067 RepID=A0A6G6ADY4_9VIRU
MIFKPYRCPIDLIKHHNIYLIMPSKIRKNKTIQKYDKLFPVYYKEFGVTKNKKNIIEKFMKLTYTYKKFQKAVNIMENLNSYAAISHIVIEMKNNLRKINIKISKLKNRI